MTYTKIFVNLTIESVVREVGCDQNAVIRSVNEDRTCNIEYEREFGANGEALESRMKCNVHIDEIHPASDDESKMDPNFSEHSSC